MVITLTSFLLQIEAVDEAKEKGNETMKKSTMRNSVANGVLVAVLASAAVVLEAGVVAYRSIPDLVAGSDVIVVGEIIGVEVEKEADSGSVLLLPIEVLKGTIPGGVLQLSYQRIQLGQGEGLRGKRALAFAKLTSDSKALHKALQLVPILDGAGTFIENQLLVADTVAPQPVVTKTPQDTPLQKVIKELATIQAHSSSSEALAYLMPLAWGGTEIETSRDVFRALRQAGSPGSFVQGTAGLVALGELEGLEALDSAEPQGRAELDDALQLLERFYSSPDPRGVQVLGRWLQAGSPAKMRAAAAGALARIHTPEAVLILGTALHDADFQVRWRAIGGLSMFANNVPVGGAGPEQGPWPFRTDDTARFSAFDEDYVRENEASHLGFWRAWWADNESAVKKLLTDPNH